MIVDWVPARSEKRFSVSPWRAKDLQQSVKRTIPRERLSCLEFLTHGGRCFTLEISLPDFSSAFPSKWFASRQNSYHRTTYQTPRTWRPCGKSKTLDTNRFTETPTDGSLLDSISGLSKTNPCVLVLMI